MRKAIKKFTDFDMGCMKQADGTMHIMIFGADSAICLIVSTDRAKSLADFIIKVADEEVGKD